MPSGCERVGEKCRSARIVKIGSTGEVCPADFIDTVHDVSGRSPFELFRARPSLTHLEDAHTNPKRKRGLR